MLYNEVIPARLPAPGIWSSTMEVPDMGNHTPSDLPARMTAKVRVDANGCWEWLGYVQSNGYGKVSYEGKARLAHRVSYMILVGHIPDSLVLDHICRNRHCCNPDHLRAVTQRDNALAPGSESVPAATTWTFSRATTPAPAASVRSSGTGRDGRSAQRSVAFAGSPSRVAAVLVARLTRTPNSLTSTSSNSANSTSTASVGSTSQGCSVSARVRCPA